MSSTLELLPYSDQGSLKEIDERVDSANSIKLLLDPEDGNLVVAVRPVDSDEMPFGLKVGREEALDAFAHPYPYRYAATLLVESAHNS